MASTGTEATTDREIVMRRVVRAPRELVWKVWTEPEHVAQWWGPDGFTNTVREMDVRPGGVWRILMHGPDGTDYPNRMLFTEVVPPERLVYEHSGEDENDDHEFIATVTFDTHAEGTEVTLRLLFESAAERDRVAELGAVEGGRQTMARLAAYAEAMAG